jgi:hypothetical protein
MNLTHMTMLIDPEQLRELVAARMRMILAGEFHIPTTTTSYHARPSTFTARCGLIDVPDELRATAGSEAAGSTMCAECFRDWHSR